MFLADQMLISFDIRIDQFSSVFSFQGTEKINLTAVRLTFEPRSAGFRGSLPRLTHQPSGNRNNFTLLVSHRSCDLYQDRLDDLVRDAYVRSTSSFIRVCDLIFTHCGIFVPLSKNISLAAACSSIPSPV